MTPMIKRSLSLLMAASLLVLAGCGVAPSSSSSSGTSRGTKNPPPPTPVPPPTPTPTPGGPPNVTIPDNAVVTSDLQTMANWGICVAACANMPAPATYTMKQNVAAGSLTSANTGASLFEGGTSFGGVMWNNHLGKSTATHFVMDFYIKLDHPENAQALEFAVLKMDGYNWYKFSTQCNYASGQLRGFDTSIFHWASLNANCVKAQPNTWQRVTLQYSITGGTANFEGVSFDGVAQPIAVSLPAVTESYSSDSMGVHFQLDNARTTTGYTVYVDHWTVYSW